MEAVIIESAAQIRMKQLIMQERQELMHLQLPLVMLTEIIR